MNADDSAWVTIDLPCPLDQTRRLAEDPQRLLRLNPYLELRLWQTIGPDHWRAGLFNETNGLTLATEVRRQPENHGYSLEWDRGIKRRTRVEWQSAGTSSRLVLRDVYLLTETADSHALAAVDRSINAWGIAIRRHVLALQRWQWLPGYRALREGFWLGLSPRQRRISRLIVWVSVLEFVTVLFILAIWWNESTR